jgi:hypothetical protein
MTQQSQTGLGNSTRPDGEAHDRPPRAEGSQAFTAVLLWIGMAAIYVISAFAWLHLQRHGYSGRR